MNQDTPPTVTTSDAPVSAGAPTKDERNMAMLIYILAIFTGFIGPLIIWLVKKDQSAFINNAGKEVINFQITFFIGYVISALLTMVVIGCFLIPALIICNLVFCILGAMASSRGEMYRYPFNIRMLK